MLGMFFNEVVYAVLLFGLVGQRDYRKAELVAPIRKLGVPSIVGGYVGGRV